MSQEVIWKIINKYFNENPHAIVDRSAAINLCRKAVRGW